MNKDAGKAFKLFEAAATLGHTGARVSLAKQLKEGRGGDRKQELSEAAEHLLEAARQGHAGACYHLAVAYQVQIRCLWFSPLGVGGSVCMT